MTTATIRQVQHNLASVLQSVEAGEEVIIRRRNQPIARIVPINGAEERKVDWSSLNTWRTRFFARGRLPGKAVSELIAEGRGER
jgi:prevent-host-death family protein